MKRLYKLMVVGLLTAVVLGGGPLWAGMARVDVNRATAEQLEAIPGIGPAKAKAIIEYREATPFASADELQNVRGIGAKLYERIKEHVSVGSTD